MGFTTEEKLLLALDEFALGREFLFIRKKDDFSQTDLTALILDLQNDPGETGLKPVTGEPERNFRNYRKLLPKFGIPISYDFKANIFEDCLRNPDNIYKACSYYLRRICLAYDDSALSKLIKASRSPKDILYQIITIKYSIKFKLPMEMEYAKFMSRSTGKRVVIPLFIHVQNGVFDLIGIDKKDGIIKQFILARILSVESDIHNLFYKAQAKLHTRAALKDWRIADNYSIDEYLQSDAGNFFREKVKFKVRLLGYSYEHFQLFYNFQFSIIEKKSATDITVEFESSDYQMVYRMIFDYRGYAKIVSPITHIDLFREQLESALENI